MAMQKGAEILDGNNSCSDDAGENAPKDSSSGGTATDRRPEDMRGAIEDRIEGATEEHRIEDGGQGSDVQADKSTGREPKAGLIHEKQPIGSVSRGRIIIENLLFSTYIYEHSDETKLLAARRTLCGFNIYALPENNRLVAQLRANIFGTRYSLGDALAIRYETSFLQRGRPRSFVVGLDGLQLCNKKPYFNNDTFSYSLNFNGRITQPSVRNLQVIHPLDPTYITLTFGKEENNAYILDFSYPWSPLKAFCIALSALDHKFGCD